MIEIDYIRVEIEINQRDSILSPARFQIFCRFFFSRCCSHHDVSRCRRLEGVCTRCFVASSNLCITRVIIVKGERGLSRLVHYKILVGGRLTDFRIVTIGEYQIRSRDSNALYKYIHVATVVELHIAVILGYILLCVTRLLDIKRCCSIAAEVGDIADLQGITLNTCHAFFGAIAGDRHLHTLHHGDAQA